MKVTENAKWRVTKKRQIRQKKGVMKKKDFFGRDALRAAIWTIGTSGKALHDCKTIAFNSYRNLVSTEVCTNNKKTVLLNVLLYCPGSTVPGYAMEHALCMMDGM